MSRVEKASEEVVFRQLGGEGLAFRCLCSRGERSRTVLSRRKLNFSLSLSFSRSMSSKGFPRSLTLAATVFRSFSVSGLRLGEFRERDGDRDRDRDREWDLGR